VAAVSIRYARALADVIADTKLDAAKALEQLRSLVAAFQESRELREVWESPAILVEQKQKVLDALSAAQLYRGADREGPHRVAG
jgi:F0F1-type ATP synthase delta subunit